MSSDLQDSSVRSSARPDGVETLTGDHSLELPEFEQAPASPITLLQEWVVRARDRNVREPMIATLSTSSATGEVAARSLLVKEIDDHGLVFCSQSETLKGRHLAENPRGALTFYWRELLQQVTVVGDIVMEPTEESDRLFEERPFAAQVTNSISRQGRTLEPGVDLKALADQRLETGGVVERPASWVAFRMTPLFIEFWHGSPTRLHRRLAYEREPRGAWTNRRLQP